MSFPDPRPAQLTKPHRSETSRKGASSASGYGALNFSTWGAASQAPSSSHALKVTSCTSCKLQISPRRFASQCSSRNIEVQMSSNTIRWGSYTGIMYPPPPSPTVIIRTAICISLRLLRKVMELHALNSLHALGACLSVPGMKYARVC